MYNYGTSNTGNYAGNTNYASSAAKAAATSNSSSPNYSGGPVVTDSVYSPFAGMGDASDNYWVNVPGEYTSSGNDYMPDNPTHLLIDQTKPQQPIQPIIQQPQLNTQQYLQELKEAQRKSRIAALESARTNALTDLDTYKNSRTAAMDTARGSNLTNYKNSLESSNAAYDTEGATIAPEFYNKRNQAAAASDVGAMNFAQYMAARGVRGPSGAMPEIYRNTALQGQIGALDQAEAQTQADLARRRTATQTAYDNNVANLETAYQGDLSALTADYDTRKLGIQSAYDSDLVGANADVDAASLQAYITQMNADRAYALQQSQLAQERELADMSYQKKTTDAAKQEYVDTLGQFSNDYAAEINRVQGDNDASNDWQIAYLQAARQKKLQEQEEAAASTAARAARAAGARSSGGSESASMGYSGKTAGERQEQATGEALAGISQMAAAGKTYREIYNYVQQNAGILQSNGADMDQISAYLSSMAQTIPY
jgi:hypothetical protein